MKTPARVIIDDRKQMLFGICGIEDANGNVIAELNDRPTADFIVKAVNGFEMMKDALDKTNQRLIDLDDDLNQGNHTLCGYHLNGESEPISTFFDGVDDIIEIATTTLSKVFGDRKVEKPKEE